MQNDCGCKLTLRRKEHNAVSRLLGCAFRGSKLEWVSARMHGVWLRDWHCSEYFLCPCVSFVGRIEVLTVLEKYPPAVSTKCKSISLKVTHNHRPLSPSVPILGLSKFDMGRVMRKGPGRHDKWSRVIGIWNLRQNKSKMAEALRYIHSRSDFYGFNCYFRTFITSITLFGEWSGQKSLKLKMDKICRPGPFLHDAAHIFVVVVRISLASFISLVPVVFIILVYYFFQTDYLWLTCSSFQTRKRKTKRKKHDFQIPAIVVTEVPWLFKDKKLQDFYRQW